MEAKLFEQSKLDWKNQVHKGLMSPKQWKEKYGVSNGKMTRIYNNFSDDFKKVGNWRVFTTSELALMQSDWRKVEKGSWTLTRFKNQYGLGGETYGRLMEQHGELFKPVKIERGSRRWAEKRRKERHDPERVKALNLAWERDVLSGDKSPSRFYKDENSSKGEITEFRKVKQFLGYFKPAIGIRQRKMKESVIIRDKRLLSRIWKEQVCTWQLSITRFKQDENLSDSVYKDLLQDKQAFPDRPPKPQGVRLRPQRTFSAAQLELYVRDWQRVEQGDPKLKNRQAFMRQHKLDSNDMKQLRDQHPEVIPPLGGKTRRIVLDNKQLARMKTSWLAVVAGQLTDNEFKRQHPISSSIWKRYREDGDTAADFPWLKGNKTSSRAEHTLSSAAAKDWEAVRAGKLQVAAFQRRHPQLRAADLVVHQRELRRTQKSVYAELAQELKQQRLGPTPETRSKLRQIKARWPEVQSHKISRRQLLAEVGLSENTFLRWRDPQDLPEPGPRPKEPRYSASQIKMAGKFFHLYQREHLSFDQLNAKLTQLGISNQRGQEVLRQLDPVTFANRKEFFEHNRPQMVKDLVKIILDHRYVIKKWSDFEEVMAQQPAFQKRYGQVNLKPSAAFVRQEMQSRGELFQVMHQIGLPVGQGQGPDNGKRVAAGRKQVKPSTRVPPKVRRDSARELARELKGLDPTPENLKRVVARLGESDANFSTKRKWMNLRANFEGVFPELKRWDFQPHRPYSLRFVARWTEAAHQAGPGASYEAIAEIFKRSPEYREDGRLPPKRSGTTIMAQQHPELISSWATRRTYQTARLLLETLRTAPKGSSLYQQRALLKQLGKSYRAALLQLNKLTPAHAERHGLDPQLLLQFKRGGFKGLGQKPDPRFDPNAEPPGINMTLVKEVLDTPEQPELLKYAVSQLGGERVFRSHNVMFINHRYSDILSLVDSFADAGMTRKTAVFVSTPYPFKDSVSYQLRKRGLTVYEPQLSMKSYTEQVERGIRKMLRTYDDQVKSQGKGKPILIVDDGGMASKMIKTTFKEHIGKFRIVEITPAGHRLAKQFKQELKRLPFVYFSLAYTELKRKVTSSFFARRVVKRVFNLLPQSGLKLNNKRATVLGGGPMALFSAYALKERDYQVTMVEPLDSVANELRGLGFDVKPLAQALPGRGLVLGMSGYESLKAEHLRLIDNDAVVVQGSSKRQEFEMDAIEKMASGKRKLPRKDGLAQKSYTYSFKQDGKAKQLHFLGDGWTINHDGSLHGTPMEDIQLELALVFETAAQAARVDLRKTGVYREVSVNTQNRYHAVWQKMKEQRSRGR